MTSIARTIFRMFTRAALKLLEHTILVALMSTAAVQAASSQNGKTSSEPAMCLRLQELTVEFPNPQADRLLSKHTSEERCRQYFWYVHKIKPLNQILSVTEVDIYKAAIARHNCQEATAVLQKRFADAHPRTQFILTEKKELEFWQEIVVGNHFHDLYLCRIMTDLDKAQREIDRANVTFAPYRGNTFHLGDRKNIGKRAGIFDPKVEARDKAVVMLMDINFAGKRPIYSRALLKLSQAGVALELHPLWELFLALRLRDAGVNDPLVTAILSRPVDPKVRADIERHAEDKLNGWTQVPVHPHRPYPKKANPD